MLAVIVAFILLVIFLAVAALWLAAAKWFKAPHVTYAAVVNVAILTAVVGLGALLVPVEVLQAGLFCAAVAVAVYSSKRFFRVSWNQAAGIVAGAFCMAAVATYVVVFISNYTFAAGFVVTGASMAPTMNNGDYVETIRTGLPFEGRPYVPERGQIVVLKNVVGRNLYFIKRVVGLAGDHLVLKNGKVTVYNADNPNGFDPDAAYGLAGTNTSGTVNIVVPSGDIYVMGDNRGPGASFDSRDYGPVPTSDIVSTVVMRTDPTFAWFY